MIIDEAKGEIDDMSAANVTLERERRWWHSES